jgi:multidrug resistance efflux pump
MQAVARARALRGFMTLTAPADGQILRRDGEIGQLIPANQPIFYFAAPRTAADRSRGR